MATAASVMLKAVRNYGLLSLWLLAVGLMCHDYVKDPYDPTLTGTAAYGHNGKGALQTMLVLSVVELIVLYLILQPWSYRRSWWRPLLALVLLVPWTFLSMVASMHADGVSVLHWLWLSVTTIILAACALVSLVGCVRHRRSTFAGVRT